MVGKRSPKEVGARQVFILLALVEQLHLASVFPESYRSYRDRTGFLIPFVVSRQRWLELAAAMALPAVVLWGLVLLNKVCTLRHSSAKDVWQRPILKFDQKLGGRCEMTGERMGLIRIYVAAIVLLGIALACESPTPLPSSSGQETTNKQDTTQKEEASRDEGKAQNGDDCILQAGADFSWAYSEPAVQQGSYARACSYDFTIRNTSNEDQKVILYELWDNTGETGGMTWEKWNVRLLAAGGSYTYDFSYSTWDNGTDTWHYADKLLVIRDTPECFALSVAANEANLLLWEQHATRLENICK